MMIMKRKTKRQRMLEHYQQWWLDINWKVEKKRRMMK